MTEITVLNCVIVFVLCYLTGSIPTAYIFVKAKTSKDITKEGSGNVGTLNSFTVTKSKSIGIAVLFLDLFKGILPVYVMLSVLSLDYFYASLGASAVILGHNYPVWLKFKGGRGLAPGAGIFLILNYFVVIGWGIVWLIVFLLRKKVLISNTIATFCLPLYVLIINLFDFLVVGNSFNGFELSYFTVFSIMITVIILSRHTEVFKKDLSHKN
jgi:acyl phosphate:glycerol-3-phosphate acyltransferase